MLEKVRALVEPVAPPKGTLEYQHYFVAATPGDIGEIKNNESKRVALYRSVSSLVRAYTALANDMDVAGYSARRGCAITEWGGSLRCGSSRSRAGCRREHRYEAVRSGHACSSGHLHSVADPSEVVATFEKGLVDLIVERGERELRMHCHSTSARILKLPLRRLLTMFARLSLTNEHLTRATTTECPNYSMP